MAASVPSHDWHAVRRLFISYAREDLHWAQEQARVARRSGQEAFLDTDSIRAGEDWPESLERAIEKSDQVVLGWSRHAAESEWVEREYTKALEIRATSGDKRFLTIDLLDETPLPPSLEKIQAERSALSSKASVERLLYKPDRELPDRLLPSFLLRPEYGVAPFWGRVDALEDLGEWCRSPGLFKLALYTGPGGSGKTRLMVEACRRLRSDGWDARFLDAAAAQVAITGAPEALDALVTPRRPLLIVLDYSETRREQVRELVQRGARKRSGEVVRVVLLARAIGDWWQELSHASILVREVLEGSARHVELGPLGPTSAAKLEIFVSAAAAYAEKLGKSAPTSLCDLSAGAFDRALFIHLLALLVAEGKAPAAGAELLAAVLEHERSYWARLASDRKLGEPLVQSLGAAAAAITLAGGCAGDDDLWDRILKGVPDLRERGRADRKMVGRLFLDLYQHEGRIEPLQPDLLGEELVARELGADRALLAGWLEGATALELHHGLTVLDRLARGQPEAERWLEQAVGLDTASVAEAAISVAVETGDPIGRVVADHLTRHPEPELSSTLEPRLPEQTVALRELGVVLTQQAVARLAGEREPTEAGLAERARLLNNLGVRLGGVGRREEALAAAEEAVKIRRELAESRPDAFLPDLAMSLNNVGAMLSEVGGRERALAAVEEAVEVYRDLAGWRPDAILPDLAASLHNLGAMLSKVGRREEALAAAEEALKIRRELAELRPDAFLPDLAMSLNNVGAMLSEVGRREEALAASEEAVGIYRELAESRPDAFLPDLAMSLNNLGKQLSEVGRQEEALAPSEETVGIYRDLAGSRPDAFLPYLAVSLNNVGLMLSGVGRREEALAAAEEAVKIRRDLAGSRPDAFLPYLATSLHNLGLMLSEVGRRDDALAASKEAVKLRRDLAGSRPDAFLPDLAMSLNNLGNRLSEMGRREEALAASEEAVKIFRELAASHPDAFLPSLARSLNNLSNRLSELGCREEELAALAEGAEILRTISGQGAPRA